MATKYHFHFLLEYILEPALSSGRSWISVFHFYQSIFFCTCTKVQTVSTAATSSGGSGCFSVATIIKRSRRRKRSPPWEFWEKMIPLPNSGRWSAARLACDVPRVRLYLFVSLRSSATAAKKNQKNKTRRLNCILEIHLAQKSCVL